MRDDDTPSTPVRGPLHFEDGDDLPTPTKLSPSATRLNASRNSPTRAAAIKAEVAAQREDNAVRLSYDDSDVGSVPVISGTKLELKEEKREDGGSPIGLTIQQEPNIRVKAGQEAEAGVKEENSEVVKYKKNVAVDFTDGEAEEVKERVNGFGDGFGDVFDQPEAAKGNDDAFADDFGDDFDDFGEAIEGGDDFDDFEGFEEGSTLEFSEPPTPAPAPPPVVPVLPVVFRPPIDTYHA